MRELSAHEARVLGVLVEKQATVPDTYPLSVNALLAGCNQRTARDPVLDLSEADIAAALDGLRALTLVFAVSGGRVTRWEHNLPRGLGVASQAGALLAVLMLRGPQTAAELRTNAERLHRFADLGSVEAFLDELAAKDPPRVQKLPRAPGAREARWAHRLCGDPAVATEAPEHDTSVHAELQALRQRVQRLEQHLGLTDDAL
jgi:uncharacterized protein YceH (UPF0502 family)